MTKVHVFVVMAVALVVLFATNSYALPKYVKMPVEFQNVAKCSYEIDDPKAFIAGRIQKFEGFSATKYRCTVSGVTLQGYGKHITRSTPSRISESMAKRWLKEDLDKCEEQLDQKLPWWRDLSSVHRAAMLDLTYNMGIDKLMKFKKFLKAMERRDFKTAQYELSHNNGRKSKYVKQVGVRAQEIMIAIGTNMWVPVKDFA